LYSVKFGIKIADDVGDMAQGTVVLAGVLPVEHVALDRLVGEFGWSLNEASSLCRVAELNVDHTVVTVLFSPHDLALPWDQALRAVLEAAPNALPILCHGFADAVDWPQLAEAGAFHSLRLPLDIREVRQSLGFVWEAKRRAATFATQDLQQLEDAVQDQARQDRAEEALESPLVVAAPNRSVRD
jgi:hypothetical protein